MDKRNESKEKDIRCCCKIEIDRIELRHYIEIYWKNKEQPTVTQVTEKGYIDN